MFFFLDLRIQKKKKKPRLKGCCKHLPFPSVCPQVVKVAGGNISHKLRLSSVKPSDEGTYECRVIDFSGAVAQQHRVRAHLRVRESERRFSKEDDGLYEEEAGLRDGEEDEDEEEEEEEVAVRPAAP